MLLQEFFDTTYRPLRLRGRSPATTRLYGCTIRSFGKYLERPATIADAGDELLLAAFLEHRAAEGKSPFSVEKERGQLMALARLAWERRVNPMMPCCPPTPLPERIPESWSPDDLQRLTRAAAALTGMISGVPESFWWTALLAVCFDSGERIGAIMQCRWSDLRGNLLTIRAAMRKGRRSDRVVSLSPRAVALLTAAHLPGREELLYWTLSPSYLWDRFRTILATAGLQGRRLGFQQVRRGISATLSAAATRWRGSGTSTPASRRSARRGNFCRRSTAPSPTRLDRGRPFPLRFAGETAAEKNLFMPLASLYRVGRVWA